MSDDREALAQTRRELRREVGPSGVGDGDWQPMVAASELWRLLDALDEIESTLRQLVARDDEETEPRCQHVSPSPWGPTQCALAAGHDERHAYSPSETL